MVEDWPPWLRSIAHCMISCTCEKHTTRTAPSRVSLCPVTAISVCDALLACSFTTLQSALSCRLLSDGFHLLFSVLCCVSSDYTNATLRGVNSSLFSSRCLLLFSASSGVSVKKYRLLPKRWFLLTGVSAVALPRVFRSSAAGRGGAGRSSRPQ